MVVMKKFQVNIEQDHAKTEEDMQRETPCRLHLNLKII